MMNATQHRIVSTATAISIMGLMIAACSAAPDQRDIEGMQASATAESSGAASKSDSGGNHSGEAVADPDEGVPASGSAFGDPIYGIPPPTDPEDEVDLRGAIISGTNYYYFADDCVSVRADGSVIDGADVEELPVGGGAVLHCTIAEFPVETTVEFTTKAHDTWCILETYQSHTIDGVKGLDVRVTGPGPGPAQLTATHEGDPIMIKRAVLLGLEIPGATNGSWPLWIWARYSTKDVKKGAAGQCDAAFGRT